MASNEIEYAWLTSALRARGNFFGSREGLPLPFLLRHGIAASTRRHQHVAAGEEIEFIRTGGRHFYLAVVDENGGHLCLDKAFYLVEWPLDAMVVGPKLFGSLQEQCNLDMGYVLPIDRRFVSAHAWNYVFPTNPKDDSLYLRIYETLEERDLETVGGDHELMRKLCERHPAPVDLPQMHLILAPSLIRRADVEKVWNRDCIVITAGPNAMVRTRHGDVPATPELFRTQPILDYEGFLVPPAAAPLFNTGSDTGWPALTCMKKVILKFT